MDTELLKAAVLHPGDEQQLNGTTTSVNVDVHRAVENDVTSLNLVRNEEICRAVRSFQQISLPWSNKCCCGHGTNKIGRIKYIFLVSIIMIAPMEFNAFSFLLPFASPLDDTAYFDGCYQYLGSDVQETKFPYLDCLACNNNVPYVNTSSLNSKPQNQTFYLTASSIVGVVALFFAVWYFNLATRALIYGALLSFGVYTEITPIFFDSKRKMLILFVIAVYSAIGAYMSVASAQTLEVILETLTIGNSATGSCFQDVSGISSNEAVHASFSANNPAVTHLDASTSSVKSAILTYATAIFVYVPILLSFYGVLAHPYNSFDAGELFEGVEDTADTNGNTLRKKKCAAIITADGEKTIAKVIQENIRFRIREEALMDAVLKVHGRWSKPRILDNSILWREYFAVFFLVYWASSNSPEDVALVEEIVKLAMETDSTSMSSQCCQIVNYFKF